MLWHTKQIKKAMPDIWSTCGKCGKPVSHKLFIALHQEWRNHAYFLYILLFVGMWVMWEYKKVFYKYLYIIYLRVKSSIKKITLPYGFMVSLSYHT